MEVGTRVGAVASSNDGKLELFGYGTYEGSHVPDTDDVIIFGFSLKSKNMSNPRIKLDNGDTVYGAECWWGDEERIKQMEANAKEVKIVSIADYRQRAKESLSS